MKGRNNARTHRGNYGTHKSEGVDRGKHKHPTDYSGLYKRFPNLAKRPALSSLTAQPENDNDSVAGNR